MKQIEEIIITGKVNGICVKVGCKELVYQQGQFKQFFKDLQAYFDAPDKAKEKIFKRYGIEEPTLNVGCIQPGGVYVYGQAETGQEE